jgi:hypothetical protein
MRSAPHSTSTVIRKRNEGWRCERCNLSLRLHCRANKDDTSILLDRAPHRYERSYIIPR